MSRTMESVDKVFRVGKDMLTHVGEIEHIFINCIGTENI